jgi:hypothetical protein
MNKFFQDIMTENDGRTWCIARVGVFFGIITFIILGFIHTIYNHTIDFSGFGMGLGALLGGGGVYVGAQAATDKGDDVSTEPK